MRDKKKERGRLKQRERRRGWGGGERSTLRQKVRECGGSVPGFFVVTLKLGRSLRSTFSFIVLPITSLVVVGLTYGCRRGGNLQGLPGWIAASASLGSLGTVADHSQIYRVRAPALVALTGLYNDEQGCTIMECFLGLSNEDNQNNLDALSTEYSHHLLRCNLFHIAGLEMEHTP